MSTGYEYEVDVAEDFEGSSDFLNTPGKYHAVIMETKIGVGPKGKAYDGVTLSMSVLCGPEEKKTFNHMVGFPSETDDDGGEFRRKVMSRTLVVTNLVNPTEKGKKAKVDFSKLDGQQIVVDMAFKKDRNSDKEYLNIGNSGLAIYHVDDPAVEKVPKNADALKLIPTEWRRKPEWFEQLKSKPKPPTGSPSQNAGNGGGNGNSSSSAAPKARANLNEL